MALFEQFPYLNFHELNLNWILQKVKECESLVYDNDKAFKELKDYVTNYFDSTDFNAMVSAKLDDMYENGDLGRFIADLMPFVTPQMFGAVADGVADDTAAFADAISSGSIVVVPPGSYAVSEIIPGDATQIAGAGRLSKIVPLSGNSNDIILKVGRTKTGVKISGLQLSGGANIGYNDGAQTDMNSCFRDLIFTYCYGVEVNGIGCVFENIHIGGCVNGFIIRGTDNFFSNCVTANVDGDGFRVNGSNNELVNCKAYLSGRDYSGGYGAGFYIGGNVCSLTGCTAQENYFENFFFAQAQGCSVAGCISDGAFSHRSDIPQTYLNRRLNATCPTASIHLGDRCVGNIIDIADTEGFFGWPQYVLYFFGAGLYHSIKQNNITITRFDRNTEHVVKDINGSLLLNTTDNVINYNGDALNTYLLGEYDLGDRSASFPGGTQEWQEVVRLSLPADVKYILGTFGENTNRANLSNIYSTAFIFYTINGESHNVTTPWAGCPANGSAGIDLKQRLQALPNDAVITSIQYRIMAQSNSSVADAFDFTIEDINLRTSSRFVK